MMHGCSECCLLSHIKLLIMEGYSVTPNTDEDDIPDILGVRPDNISDRALLCKCCQRFDIRSFARSASQRRGYLLRDVQASASDGCEFCSLLLDSVKNVESRPTPLLALHTDAPLQQTQICMCVYPFLETTLRKAHSLDCLVAGEPTPDGDWGLTRRGEEQV